MPHAHHAGFQSEQVALTLDIVLVALILVSLIYVRGWLRLRRLEPDTVHGWHGASFLLGMFCIWLAVASPLAALDHQLLTIHIDSCNLQDHGLVRHHYSGWERPLPIPHCAGLPPPARWLDGTSLPYLCSGCNPRCGMELSRRLSWHPDFSSGGQSSGHGPLSQLSLSGRISCICFSRRCRAISSLGFSSFATASSIGLTARHHRHSGFLLSKTSSVPVR